VRRDGESAIVASAMSGSLSGRSSMMGRRHDEGLDAVGGDYCQLPNLLSFLFYLDKEGGIYVGE
jgi:hypothetical protein